MHDEIEAKFYPVDPVSIREKLTGIGARCIHPERLMRRAIFNRVLNPQLDAAKIRYIRVRDEGDRITLSMKDYPRPEEGVKWQREICIIVSSFEDTVSLLKVAGLKQNTYQETKRETWQFGQVLIEIDTWPGLLPYVEIEAPSEVLLHQVALQLQLDWEARLNEAVTVIYAKVYGIERDKINSFAQLTFENNPFADLKAVI